MLDSLLSMLGIGGNGGGILPPFIGQAQAQQQQPQPQMPQPAAPGFGDRLMAGAQGFLNSSSPMGAVGNLLGGLASGSRTDPAGVQGDAVRKMLQQLQASGKIDATTAQFLAANPKAWEELSKAMINVPMTVAPSGDIIQNRPFGQLNVPGAVPISQPKEVVNSDGSRSPGFSISPSLSNPSGGFVQPGQARPAAPMPGAAPVPGAGGPPMLNPMLNPNMPNGGRGIITEQSPQAIEEQKGVGGDLAKEYADINKKAAAATTRLGTLNRLSQLSPDAYSGAAAPAIQLVRSLLSSFGFDPGKVPQGEEFVSLSNKMVLDANNGSLGTGVSNADVAFIKNMQPDIAQTREGRQQIIETSRQLAKRDQEVSKQAATYRRQNGSMDGFQVYIQDWADKNPMFKDVRPPSANFGERFSATNDPRPGAPGIRIIGVR